MVLFYIVLQGHLVCADLSFPKIPAELSAAEQIVWLKPSENFQMEIQLFEKHNSKWGPALSSFPAVFGIKGFAPKGQKKEGNHRTPQGPYLIGTLLCTADRFEGKWPYQKLGPEDKWIDDATSSDYNHFVYGSTTAKSFENLLRQNGLYD